MYYKLPQFDSQKQKLLHKVMATDWMLTTTTDEMNEGH